ncbi:Dur3p [Sugiyamaella lignohabitans]|uniref:Dur3p n=1 Tax=Sugiyamaella lignohabitans TaxID=796027 RepID=A0A161HL45_9ASCO|nr:Dur3p [Sugiyamaella lignohabitans]ANB12688.1 Dur3p [Sugiyamaella lignohabitans]
MAIELKKKAPTAHTFLEVVRQRYGTATHIVYLCFGLATNILVTAMLLTGGSAVVSDLTGMNTVAACFLLPLGVVIYTLFGGIRATFLTDYIHTVIIYVIILVFAFTVYATSDLIGSPGRLYDLLVKLAETSPLAGNAEGSYLTMKSRSGGIFYVINLAGNFGTVFLDNGYWNKAIAASPASALPGYVMGGLAWFSIPWLLATTLGLAALALQHNPAWPTYPNPMSAADVSAGLVLPNAAVALLGKGGAGAALILVFMAVTSASSAELIAVSSIFTFDIYKTYFNPTASGKRLIWITHTTVIAYGLVMAGFSVGLFYAGVSMGYLYLLMGVIISAGVIPLCLTLMWKGLNWHAATFTPVIGFIFAITSWLSTTKGLFGTLNVTTTGSEMPMLAGNVVALCSPLVIVPVLTLIFKMDNYDFEELKNIKSVKDDYPVEEETTIDSTEASKTMAVVNEEAIAARDAADQLILHKYSKIARILTVVIALSLLIIWPMPMYGSGYIFSKKFFTGWVVVAVIWGMMGLLAVGVYPLIESRLAIAHTLRGIFWDLTGQSYKLRAWQNAHPEEMHGHVQRGVDAQIFNAPGSPPPELSEREEKE